MYYKVFYVFTKYLHAPAFQNYFSYAQGHINEISKLQILERFAGLYFENNITNWQLKPSVGRHIALLSLGKHRCLCHHNVKPKVPTVFIAGILSEIIQQRHRFHLCKAISVQKLSSQKAYSSSKKNRKWHFDVGTSASNNLVRSRA